MGLLSSLSLIFISGAIYYWLVSKAIEKYQEAWIDGRGFGLRVLVYTTLYYLIVLYAVFGI